MFTLCNFVCLFLRMPNNMYFCPTFQAWSGVPCALKLFIYITNWTSTRAKKKVILYTLLIIKLDRFNCKNGSFNHAIYKSESFSHVITLDNLIG